MKLKFEKINMKIVITVGIAIILLLTALFIIFRTNILFDSNKDKDKSNTNTNTISNTNTNTNTNTGSNTNTSHNDPNDPQNLKVSEEAKNRTKTEVRLNEKEKLYIIEENAKNDLGERRWAQCKQYKIEEDCHWEVSGLTKYSADYDTGYFITGCTGMVYMTYDEEKKEFVYDMSKVECK